MSSNTSMYVHQQNQYNGYSFTDHSHSTSMNGSAVHIHVEQGESATSILQSVKEQEAQFERLTRELEAEGQSVANQLGNRKVNSGSASTNSINSQDESYKWRQTQETNVNESDDSHLVNSCMRELQERGIMEGHEPLHMNDPTDQNLALNYEESLSNNGYADRNMASPQSSQNSYQQQQAMNAQTTVQNNYSHSNNYASHSRFQDEQNTVQHNGYSNHAYQQNTLSGDDYYQQEDGQQSYTDHPAQRGEDYMDSNQIASYMNSRDYQDSRDLEQPTYDQQYPEQSSLQYGNYDPNYGIQDQPVNQQTDYDDQFVDKFSAVNLSSVGYHDNPSYRVDSPHGDAVSPDDDRYIADNHSLHNQYNRSREELRQQPPQYEDETQQATYSDQDRGFPYNEQHQEVPSPTAYNTNGVYPNSNIHVSDMRPNIFGSRQSIDSRPEVDQKWRVPELPEVIEYLSHPSDAIKANAAAYLQHLCYGNNTVKSKARALGGIPALIELLKNDIPEVHRNACGTLLNLSRGYENDENKRAIKNAGGIDALTKLLSRSQDNDVRELTTGILWNLSSMGELKRSVIDSALVPLVQHVIIPTSDWTKWHKPDEIEEVYWSTVFRNATGVLRNISSEGYYARKILRECDGLVESLLHVTKGTIGKTRMDNKSVENCVCTLRNLSYRLMEVDYPDYYEKKNSGTLNSQQQNEESLVPGCFGKSKKNSKSTVEYLSRTQLGQCRGEQLWQPEVANIYLPLLSECSNPDTLEAAAGAVQNLTACPWYPSTLFREQVRKQKGLPIIVELLSLEADGVVCGAAIALRNLAIDPRNKTLIGKYAIGELVSKLPSGNTSQEMQTSEDTIRSVIACLYEVIRDSNEHASSLVNETDGVSRLMAVSKSRRKYTSQTLRGAHQLLAVLWKVADLRSVYRSKGWKETDFLSRSMLPRPQDGMSTIGSTRTLSRTRGDAGSNTNTVARSNTGYRNDNPYHEGHERPVDVSESYLARHSSNGTLQIQRPVYQQDEDPYRQIQHPQPTSYNYSQIDNYERYPSFGAGNYNSSQQALNINSDFHGASQADNYGQVLQEPLYARVDKRKSGNDNAFGNPGYQTSQGISMTSLNELRSGDHTFKHPSADTSAGVDSWV